MVPALWCCAIGEHYGRDFCFAVLMRPQCSSAQDASGEALAGAGASGDDDSHACNVCCRQRAQWWLGGSVLQTYNVLGSRLCKRRVVWGRSV